MRIPSWSARTNAIQLSGDIFACVKSLIEFTRLHKALPPRTVIADQCTSPLSKTKALYRHEASCSRAEYIPFLYLFGHKWQLWIPNMAFTSEIGASKHPALQV
jgi:hypothetical protein